MEKRLLTLPELGLLMYMLRGKPNAERILALLPTAEIEDMDDGGMGSLHFVSSKQNRYLGQVVAELWYKDEDEVPVLASLYLDTEGDLYELDSWKADSTPLKRIPTF